MNSLRQVTAITAMVLGVIMVLGGFTTHFLVTNTLADQNITVADDASCLAGKTVDGPFTAYCQAKVIEEHTLESTDGKTYAELERDDPRRDLALKSSFLQASLFTSVVAIGLAWMNVAIGLLFVLIGLGIRDVEKRISG